MPPSTWLPFEEVDHTADLAIVARGVDLPDLALNACRGVISLITDPAGLSIDQWVDVSATGPDDERTLVRFVKQLLFQWAIVGGLPVAAELSPPSGEEIAGRIGFAHPDDIDAHVRGIPKAVTYHDLAIERVGDRLEITLILDV